MQKSHKPINPGYSALKIALIYFVISIIWIIASDQLLNLTVGNRQLFTTLAMFKGSLFVVVTAVLIYFLVYRNLVSIKSSGEDLTKSEKKFREIFNKANDMISVNTMAAGGIPGKFLEVNEVMSKNMSPADIISPDIKIPENTGAILLEKGHSTYEVVVITRDGREIPVEVKSHIINYEGQDVSLSVSRDITDRKRAEDKLKSSLEEKTILLREVHHRVNNSLQIISSLFNLQSSYVDENYRDVLLVSQSRVKSMAMIYEKLYQSPDLTHINIKDYVESFVSNLFSLYGVETGIIQTQIKVSDIEMGMDTAIPLGLIINELVTNSLKHAFPDGIKGKKIQITLNKNNGLFKLEVADNGVGIPETEITESPKTLGLQLVKSLVNQLNGTMTITIKKGTMVEMLFKEVKYKERL
ncbi:MAG: histidine kinase dimerization/phosphoacceptor domain -containing protein [Methanobacterium formicicum]|uniref:histidine kinase dimerization/phosphoacceptor domain -containing protein n=1 Tax=Methanobacterium formicicum TaxID=2162 RepID=UPI0035309446